MIGCDGSGKSTVSECLLDWARCYGPTATVHLGRQAGNVGRALAGLPLIGGWFARLIHRKTDSVHNKLDAERTPGILPALVIMLFTLRVRGRFRRMLALRRRGLIIITDRYPQMAVPRAYGGPNLVLGLRGNGLVRWLARREQAVFRQMTRYRPDLVIRLSVDLETAYQRKPDHRRDLLRANIEATPLLTFDGAPIVDIDATQPLDVVLAAARMAVANTLETAGYAVQAPAGSGDRR